ncbi:LGFP repeat protein [Brevibacterium mcbrellneri ATCC 49030]|uniref:LGFP repeat protein n=1 Tax=Brevibacterium mcbrellneri ATCC 49030 TaxID=585530 RepID=D4YJ92_9MICO|nr:L,D-transpeptidase family protein [Brevibacterium mcbrellneri]EFG48703.1 LGFP repeat protein [Brevibacterium mcbrellneri ATCC 49030]
MNTLPHRSVSLAVALCALFALLTPVIAATPANAAPPRQATSQINAAAKKHAKKLGKATSSIRCGLRGGGCYQKFQNGSIHWSPKTGAHATWGAIRWIWQNNNWERGKYGYPTGSAWIGNDGKLRQKFQRGTITTGVLAYGLPHGIKPKGGRQIVIAHTSARSSKTGTVELWELRNDERWHRTHTFKDARFGYKGLATASDKREGDGKTPMGQYRIPFTFGTKAKPKGTRIEYRRADHNDQWCSRSGSLHYNTWMSVPNRSCPAKDAEVFSTIPQYSHVAVVDYNSARKAGRGSAIFVHKHGKGSTAGCVSVTGKQMVTLVTWLRPEQNPRIVIAPRGELKNQ